MATPPDFKALFEQLPGLYMVLDRNLNIVAASDEYLRATRRTRSDIGRYVFDVFPDNPDDPTSDAVANSMASFRRVLRSGATDPMVVQRHDIRLPESEGGGFEARYWSPVNSPVFGPDGSVAYVVHRVEDVTEFVRMKREGRELASANDELRDRLLRMEADVYSRSREAAASNLRLKATNEELERLYEANRQQSEALLRTSEEWFRVAQELSPDGFTILRPIRDPNGRVVDFTWVYENDAIARLNGTDPSVVIGRRLSELLPGHASSPFHEVYTRVAETGKPEVMEAPYHGDTISSLTWFRVVVVPMREDIAILAQDITERKRAEEVLQRSEERFRSVLENTADVIARVDVAAGRYDYVSPSAENLVGYSADELMVMDPNESVATMVHPDDVLNLRSAQALALEKGEARAEYRQRTKSGGYVWVSNRISVAKDRSGRPAYWTFSMRDITERKRAEEALRASEERFRSVVENMSEGLMLFDAKGNLIYQNPASLRIHGFGVGEDGRIGHDDLPVTWKAWDDEGRPITFDEWPVSRVFRKEPFQNQVLHVLRPETGYEFYGSYNGSPIYDTTGALALGFITIRDISEQVRAKAELEARERRLRTFFDSDMVGTIFWNTSGGITDANDKFLRMTGYSREDLAAGLVDWTKMTPAEYRPFDERALDDLKTSGVDTPYEKEFVRRDGIRIPVIVGAAMLDERRHEGVAFVLDITDRKEAESAREESRAKLEAALNSMTDAVFISDTRGTFVEFNDAFVAFHRFHSRDECWRAFAEYEEVFEGRLADGTLVPFERWPAKRALAGETGTNFELHLRRRDTGEQWIASYGYAPIRDKAGNIVGSVVVGRDITDIKRADEVLRKAHAELEEHARKLEETNKELEGFAYTISHDLRAPLRAVSIFAHTLAMNEADALSEDGKRRLTIIEANGLRMGQLIDDLLAFSRAGRTEISFSDVDMNQLIGEILETLKAGENKERLGVKVENLPVACGDPVLIRQVLTNLLSNAVKFSRKRPRPQIEVGSFTQSGENIYYIKDNGIGFDMRYYDKLFAVFSRLVTEEEFEGTGVGLAIVHRLVTRQGGRVWAEAKPGQGTAFYFTLPGKGQCG